MLAWGALQRIYSTIKSELALIAMETREIKIRVNVEAARVFETVSEEQRRKIELLLSLKLSDMTNQKRSLENIMSDISQKAKERGLTPKILDSILNEP